tara:strand:- start:1219 stop:1431 length:213 start_codon:yes stop_codon:yes gene_type:complete
MKLSDYLLVLLVIIISLIAFPTSIISSNCIEFFSSIFINGSCGFSIKGWNHENFYRFISNDSKLPFFEYF